jgi:hypothetical protein
MINVLDQVQAPGRAARALQFDDDAELTAEEVTDAGYHAELVTNRGTLDCDMGTLAFKSDGSKIKWLTSTGWQDFA